VGIAPLLVLAQAGRYLELERGARQFVSEQPGSGPGWKLLGLALWQQGKDALSALERAADLLPDDPEALSNLGNALRRSGRIEHAAASHRQALAIDPNYAEAHNGLGTVLRDLGRLEEAASRFRQAATLKPDFATASVNLGGALLGLGRLEQAAVSYRRALRSNPNSVAAQTGLGTVLMALDRPEDARVCFQRAVERTPDSADAHHNLGNALLAVGQHADAARCYQHALALNPEAVASHCNLGSALRDLGQLDEAATSYRQALALSPEAAEVHNNLSVVLRLLHRHDDAEASAMRAHALNPDAAGPLVSLARLKADGGHFAEAEHLYQRALQANPDSSEACSGMAQVRRMSRADTAWLAAAQRLVARGFPPRQQAHLHYALGKYFDDIGDYAPAFRHYRRANELKQRVQPAHDPDRFHRFVDGIIGRCTREWIGGQGAEGTASDRPVFIVGMPRSGTSLAEQILASHPAVHAAGELPYWSHALQTAADMPAAAPLSRHWLSVQANRYLELLGSGRAEAARVIDKMPANFLAVGLIHAALPNARIIHLRRHPIDTCLSLYFQDFETAYAYAHDLKVLAQYYRDYLRVMEHWHSILPPGVLLDVSYEDLVADTEKWSRSMVAFIGLPWDANCLNFPHTRRTVITASNWQVRQRVSSASIGRWRHYQDHLSQDHLGPLLQLAPEPARMR